MRSADRVRPLNDQPRARVGFHDWQLGLINVQRVYTALDIGCGEGRMTEALRARVAPGAWIVALDVQSNAVSLTRACYRVDGVQASIESLPLSSGLFELVTAGHVLPSTANIPRAVRELRRVLASDGVLLAGADSESSGRRLLDWHVEACRRAGLTDQARRAAAPAARSRFTLENGAAAIAQAFRTVDVKIRDELLAFPSVDALVRLYVNGLHLRGAHSLNDPGEADALAASLAPHLRDIATAAVESDGRVIVPRRSGCFVARTA